MTTSKRTITMTFCKNLAIALAFGISTAASAQQPRLMFWMSNGLTSVDSFMAHKDKIAIISPTWYQIDGSGLVTGEPQPAVLKAAHDAHVTITPLFALFDKDKAHALFADQHAQDEMNRELVRECQENGYDGVNLDIEDVMWTDKDGLSALVAKTAAVLHQAHRTVSIDIVPGAPGHAGETAFGKWIFEEWRGAYDLKSLGQSVDLLCLMTYDQNTHWTPPGPVGGWIWTKKNLDYALQAGVPPAKLSLGVAAYGYRWYAGDPGLNKKDKTPNITADYISYATAISLRDTYGGKEQWDADDHTPWFYIYRDDEREWIFFSDTRSWLDRIQLAKENHLQGVSSWVLGEEDPSLWAALPKAR